LIEAEAEQQALRGELHHRLLESAHNHPATRPLAYQDPEAEPVMVPDGDGGQDIAVIPAPNPIPVGITARPNPMTHPETVISSWRLVSREEALAPIREALDPARRQPWWQRLANKGATSNG
jgi:hypothetical protein